MDDETRIENDWRNEFESLQKDLKRNKRVLDKEIEILRNSIQEMLEEGDGKA